MKILIPGHKYLLENFEDKQSFQTIQFIEKAPKLGFVTEIETVNDGTTNEEVLKMLINRMQTLYNKFPSEETASSIYHLKSALYAQQSRTYERQQRGVEGKYIK
jgi:hypothetical protein